MRKYLSLIIAAIACCWQSASAHDFIVGGIAYNINGDNTSVSVTYKGDAFIEEYYTGEIKVPATVTYDGKTYNVTAIGDRAFMNSPITRIDFPPAGIKSIGHMAFKNCKNLVDFVITDTPVETIGDEALYGCENLYYVDLPYNTLVKVGNSAFSLCTSLEGVAVYAETIGNGAFSGCTSLVIIDFGKKLSSLGRSVFYHCPALKMIGVESDVYSDCNSNCIVEKATGKLVVGTQSTTVVPEGVVEIGESAFANSQITNVKLPSSLTTIGAKAFNECKQLTEIFIPGKVKCIDDQAFYGCSSLVAVDLASNVMRIGNLAFGECSAIKSVVSRAVVPAEQTSVAFEPLPAATLHVPMGCKANYASREGWNRFGTIIDDVTAGEVNGDGNIDVQDVNMLINAMLGKIDSALLACPDVNNDGEIDITDLNIVINSILAGAGQKHAPKNLYIKSCANGNYQGMTPVFGNEGMFWRIAYVGTDGVEITPLDGYGKIPFSNMKIDEYSNICCAVKDNGNGGVALENPGWCLLIMNCVEKNGTVQYTLTVNKPAVRLMGTTTALAAWDEMETGCEFSVPTTADGDFVSPVLAHDALPDSGVRMFVKIPGHDWWHSEFIVLNNKIEYRGNGLDQERVVTKAGQKVYLNFATDSGRIE